MKALVNVEIFTLLRNLIVDLLLLWSFFVKFTFKGSLVPYNLWWWSFVRRFLNLSYFIIWLNHMNPLLIAYMIWWLTILINFSSNLLSLCVLFCPPLPLSHHLIWFLFNHLRFILPLSNGFETRQHWGWWIAVLCRFRLSRFYRKLICVLYRVNITRAWGKITGLLMRVALMILHGVSIWTNTEVLMILTLNHFWA